MGDNTDDADVVVETAEGEDEDELVEIENFGVVERTDSESEWVETFDAEHRSGSEAEELHSETFDGDNDDAE